MKKSFGTPERVRLVMGPEEGLSQFKGETEVPHAMEVSRGVAWMLRATKSTDVQDLADCFFFCKIGLLLLFLSES